MAMVGRPRADEMLAEVQGHWRDAEKAFRQRMPGLLQRMAFYRGQQWGSATPFGWLPQGDDPEEAREVYNYVRPTVRSAVADMLRNIPNPEAIAAHDDQRSVSRAIASQQLVKSFLRNGVIPFEELYRCSTASQIHGAAWIKVYWDPNRGRLLDQPQQPPALVQSDPGPLAAPDSTGGPDPSMPGPSPPEVDDFGNALTNQIREGEIAVEFVDVFDFLPDPNSKRSVDMRHAFHRKLVTKSTLDDRFPQDIFGDPTADRWSVMGREEGPRERDFVEDDAAAGLGIVGGPYGAAIPSNDVCELVEFWEQPTRRYPRGRLIVYSGSVIVAMGPLPYEFPWVLILGQNIVPSGLYPDGTVEDIIPLQRTVNLVASKRKEWIEKVLNPPLLVPNQADIQLDNFSDIAGDIIKYNQGSQPSWMEVPGIPQSMFEAEQQAVSLIKDVSTYSDITRGDAAPGIETGVAMAYLHEFSQGVHEPDIAMFREAIGVVLKKCLKIARDFYAEDRVVRLIGQNNRWTSKAFKSQDFDFDADIVVEAFTAAPNSRALRFAMVKESLQTGLFADTPEAAAARRMLEMDTEDRSSVDPKAVHKHRAQREHERILDDPTFQPHAQIFEDHDTHIDEHNLFRNSDDYDMLPDFARAAFDQMVTEHEQIRSMQVDAFSQEQSKLTNPSQSVGGGAPPPSDPGIESPMNGGGSAMPATPQPPSASESGPPPDVQRVA